MDRRGVVAMDGLWIEDSLIESLGDFWFSVESGAAL